MDSEGVKCVSCYNCKESIIHNSWHSAYFIKRMDNFNSFSTRVEAGSNTSTVTLRVVGGDEKGSVKLETGQYGRQSQGSWTRERLRWRGPAAIVNDRPDLSSERAPHINKTVTVKQ
jgi:hypothetical protein